MVFDKVALNESTLPIKVMSTLNVVVSIFFNRKPFAGLDDNIHGSFCCRTTNWWGDDVVADMMLIQMR